MDKKLAKKMRKIGRKEYKKFMENISARPFRIRLKLAWRMVRGNNSKHNWR
jgi:hypothetical protein